MKTFKLSFPFYILYSILFLPTIGFAQKENDSISYYYNISLKPKKNDDLAKSYLFFKKNTEYNLQQKNIKNAIYDLRMMAIIQKKMGLYSESEISCVEALKLLDKLPVNSTNTKARIGVYNHLGIIYRKIGDFKKSIELYTKIKKLNNNSKDDITIINNIASVHIDQKKYKLALQGYKEAYQKSLLLNDQKLTARILSNLGLVQSKLNIPEALLNLKKALSIRNKIAFLSGVNTSYDHLTEYYKSINNKKMALVYANKTFDLAKSRNNTEYLELALSNLIKLNKFPKSAKYIILKDSILNSKQTNKDNFAYYRYQFAQQESKLKVSQLKTQRMLIVFILVGLTFFIIYSSKINKHKREKLKQVYRTEARISKKVHDEVANDIYQVMTKLQNTSNPDETIIDNLEDIYNKTRDISKENSVVEVNKNFKNSINYLLLSYQNNNVNIITKNISKVDWGTLSEVKKITIHRVLQELLTNMKKHSKASILVISFTNKGNKLIIEYKDNGIGCKLKKSTGLLNVENRIKTIGGTITFESKINDGFKAVIVI